MISIALITLLTLFSPLKSMEKANTELRKQIREKKIIIKQMEREYDRFNRIIFRDSHLYSISHSGSYVNYRNSQDSLVILVFNHTSTFPKESIRNTDVYQ